MRDNTDTTNLQLFAYSDTGQCFNRELILVVFLHCILKYTVKIMNYLAKVYFSNALLCQIQEMEETMEWIDPKSNKTKHQLCIIFKNQA